MLPFLKAPADAPLMTDKYEIDARYRYWRRHILLTIWLGYALFYFTRKSFNAAVPEILANGVLSRSDIGLLATLFYITYGVSKFVSGIVSDRSNARYFMGIGLIATGIINILFGFSTSLWAFAVLWVLNAFFQGWGSPVCARLLTAWYSRTERGGWWALWNTAHNVGGALIPIVMAAAALHYGWRAGMMIAGCMAIVVGIFLCWRLRDRPQALGLPAVGEWRHDALEIAQQQEGAGLTRKEILTKYVLLNPYIWLLSFCYVLVYVVRNMVMDASGAMSRLPVGINATRQIAAAQQEMAREASNRAESALHGFSSSIASAWNTLSQFGSNRGSSDSVTGGADSTMSAQDSMMASRMRSAVESYAKAHNISNEQATRELASRSTRGSAGMYGDAHAEWGVKPGILGVGGGVGVRGGGRASIDWSDEDAHQASSGSRASHDARHDIDARATQDFKEASDYFTSRKVSESGSHTDNNADSRVDQLSAALNSAKQSYDQYTTNMTRSHEYAEMASRTESMSGQMSEDLSQQFAQYVMKHAPQDAEAILTNTSSPEIAERRRAMAWSFVQEQVQPGVDNAWRESRGDIGKGMESVPSGGGSQDIIADHQGHQAIIEQRTQDSNIRNDVKHQVDNMVTEYRGNIGDTQSSIRGEENIVGRQYSELQNHHKTEALSQNNKYNEEKSGQERMPGADSPQELMKRAKEYQDKHKQ